MSQRVSWSWAWAALGAALLLGCAGNAARRPAARPGVTVAPGVPEPQAPAPTQLETALAAALPDLPVARRDGAVRVVLPASRVFEPDSTALRDPGGVDLAALARLLRDCRGCAADIVVHTDAVGPAAGNRRFSAARAAALVGALQVAGAPAGRLHGRGVGEVEPVAGADQDMPAGRQANRRVEIIIRP
ncbi:MAG: OmpA family protein [Gammaproteobacteria bacterium]|nr:OmpA family protein [Gammaproteobacteria bacterium]